jgi:DNA-binding transcriptional MerR regulator/methylmalonyl-CoA mutase cobalamin-binding subunit
MNTTAFTIGAVERDTGLAKDTLRVWERRYGFPRPERDANGERLYPVDQVERLRLIKRLLDQGFRPGRLLVAGDEELATLVSAPAELTTAPVDAFLREVIDRVKANDVPGLRAALNQAMHRQGLQQFVLDTVARLNEAVGEAWMRGEFEVFEEHLYTEQMQSQLRQAIAALPAGRGSPRIVLTTVPDEQHVLGLLMSECLLTLEGATCISLGTQTPIADIPKAAAAHAADIVALSFSAAFPTRQVGPLLERLRALLPPETALWAGGAGCQRLASPTGVQLIGPLGAALDALAEWRVAHAPAG